MEDDLLKYFETEKVELKEKVTDSLVKDIEAFLNSDGGSVYIGVKDDGTVIGVPKIDETLREISDIITDKIEPNAIDCVRPEVVYEGQVIVIKLNISKGSSGIYCIRKFGLSSNGCHIRVGTTCKSLSSEMINVRYQRNFMDSDLMIKRPAYFGNITFRTLKIFLSEKGYHLDENNFEQNFKLRNLEGQYNQLAELLSDKNTVPFIVVRFRGKDKSSISERMDYGNNSILLAYDKIRNRLEAENTCVVDTTVRPRVERRLFDLDAVNEVVMNALIHNDYRITEPLIAFYDDRLEITSHGGLPVGLTREEFFMGISKPRNSSLMEIFAKLGITEHTGHGIPSVISKYGKGVFDIHDSFINVVIPYDKEVASLSGALNGALKSSQQIEASGVSITQQERSVVNQLIVNPTSTTKELEKECSISYRTVQRIISTLKEKGLLEREGSKKNGTWKVRIK